ncbi:MAG: type II secretion system protein [Pseudomonadota bacterium]|nr:type II secretion system protein [Pseudomonadota bacterium]
MYFSLSLSLGGRPARQRGVTLIELVLFIVIVSVAVAGVLAALRVGTASSADPLRRKQALMIAEGLLEEVQLAKYSFCDPTSDNADSAADSISCLVPERFGQGGGAGAGAEPVGPRPYDNVNDYAAAPGVASAAFDVGGVLSDAGGTPMNLPGYTVRLTIVPEALGGIAPGNTANDVGDVLRISVAVSYDNQTLVLDGYRTRYAPNAL